MSLKHATSTATVRTDRGLAFPMFAGDRQQTCLITFEALQDIRTKHNADIPESSEDEILAACKGEIERIASQKFDKGELSEDGMIEVRAADIP